MPEAERSRLRATLGRPSRAQVVVAGLLAVVGFAAVTQIQSYQADDTYSGYSEQALIDVLNGLAGTSQRAQAEISRLERAREELRTTSQAREAALRQARERAETLEILAGTVPVNGPGIRITVQEVEGEVSVGSVLDTVQELRTAGAEALQINGEVRIVASTSFEATLGGLVVDGTTLRPPYVIDAIGEPAAMAGSLVFAQGPIAQLEEDGATVDVVELASLDIESVRTPARTEYAEPAPGQ
jgi:uncharacterized protein YlxW (UPF0749 family)